MMTNKPLVSVITVVFNGAKTIEQTLQSVINQSYKNIEYIIVDGMSTDGTQAIVEKYNDSIACFISEPDNGIYDAMNKGVRHATGDIIAFLNSDDWYEDDAIEKVVECFQHSDAEIVHGEVWCVGKNEDIVEKTKWNQNYQSLFYIMLPHQGLFAKKSVFKKYGGFDTKYRIAADHDWLLKCYLAGVKLKYLDDTIAYFRTDGLSSSVIKTDRLLQLKEKKQIFLYYFQKKRKTQTQLKKTALRHFKNKRFLIDIEDDPMIIHNLLCNHFGDIDKNLIIFGTGVWGERVGKMLRQCNVEIKCFSDNSKIKWETELYGVKVIPPHELKEMEGHILIAIQDYGSEVARQLLEYHNKQLDWICIDDLIAGYIRDEDI